MTSTALERTLGQGFTRLQFSRFWYVYGYIAAWTAATLAVVLNRWWQFENYYFDHGIFDQVLWSASRFQAPLIDHFDPQPLNQLGDHFTPSHYLLTPLYWVTSAYEPLLVLGVLCVAASAALMFALSQKLTKQPTLSFALVVAYTLFIGLQNTMIAGYHTELPALLTLALSLYMIESKHWKIFWIFFFITLGFKETFAPIGVGIGVYLVLARQWKQGILVACVSTAYFAVVSQAIIPFFSGMQYGYTSSYPGLLSSIRELFSPEIKLKTQLVSLATFSFLPLLSLAALPLVYQDFFTRFVLADGQAAWDLGMHYSAMLSILLFFASIKGAQFLLRFPVYKRFAVLHAALIITSALGFHYKLRGPLGLAYNPAFYQHTQTMSFLRSFLAAVPEQRFVMTQNNLAPYLIHQSAQVMLLRDRYWEFMPELIVLDVRDGQSPNNYWPIPLEELVQRLELDPNYQKYAFSEDQVLYELVSEPNYKFYDRYLPPASQPAEPQS